MANVSSAEPDIMSQVVSEVGEVPHRPNIIDSVCSALGIDSDPESPTSHSQKYEALIGGHKGWLEIASSEDCRRRLTFFSPWFDHFRPDEDTDIYRLQQGLVITECFDRSAPIIPSFLHVVSWENSTVEAAAKMLATSSINRSEVFFDGRRIGICREGSVLGIPFVKVDELSGGHFRRTHLCGGVEVRFIPDMLERFNVTCNGQNLSIGFRRAMDSVVVEHEDGSTVENRLVGIDAIWLRKPRV